MCKLMPPIFADRLTSSTDSSSSIVRSLTTKRTLKEIIAKREIGIAMWVSGMGRIFIEF